MCVINVKGDTIPFVISPMSVSDNMIDVDVGYVWLSLL